MAPMSATPIWELEQALWWLVKNLTEDEIALILSGAGQLPRCCKFACDLFWVTEKELENYLRKKIKELAQ